MSESIKKPAVHGEYPLRHVDCSQAIEHRLEELIETEALATLYEEALAAGWQDREVRVAILDVIEHVLRNEVLCDAEALRVPVDFVFDVDEEGRLVGSKDGEKEVFAESVSFKRIKGH